MKKFIVSLPGNGVISNAISYILQEYAFEHGYSWEKTGKKTKIGSYVQLVFDPNTKFITSRKSSPIKDNKKYAYVKVDDAITFISKTGNGKLLGDHLVETFDNYGDICVRFNADKPNGCKDIYKLDVLIAGVELLKEFGVTEVVSKFGTFTTKELENVFTK